MGCGKGDFLLRAKYCEYRVTGIDFDPKTIDIVNSRGLHGRAMEIQDLPEKNTTLLLLVMLLNMFISQKNFC